MEPILQISDVKKKFDNDYVALKGITLDVQPGEILALLGPNGAGKTTLIGCVCGLITPTSGSIRVAGYDIQRDYRQARERIGLVPQELTTEAFESVGATVRFSRALFGKPNNEAYLETILKQLDLWDKRHNRIMTLSGGMKRRLLIAKALSHEPRLLFLDEPTAGVDVELRKSMWQQMRALRESGVTIILTTHYIEEAEEMADRIGVINHGELILVESKNDLMQKLGRKQLKLYLKEPVTNLPEGIPKDSIAVCDGILTYTFDSHDSQDISFFLEKVAQAGIRFHDLNMSQSSLEDIFVELVKP